MLLISLLLAKNYSIDMVACVTALIHSHLEYYAYLTSPHFDVLNYVQQIHIYAKIYIWKTEPLNR